MMSLTIANLTEIVKKQYFFKLRANIDAFSSLLGIQLLAILISIGGENSFYSSSNTVFSLRVSYFSANAVIGFSMIWAFVTAITITTKPYRNHDFTFVTNRLSSSLSNIMFLLTASIIGGVTAMLARNLPLVLRNLFFDNQIYIMPITVSDFLLGIFVAIVYLFGVSAIGYFVGTLVQISKLFVLFLPTLFIGMLILGTTINGEPFIVGIFKFYFMESSIGLFLLKMFMTTAFFFIASISMLNRMEVRR